MKKLLCIIIFYQFCGLMSAQLTIIWESKTPYPFVPRIDFSHFLIDSNLYIIGGDNAALQQYNEVWRYNLNSDSWQQLRNIHAGKPTACPGFSLLGKGYFCTGLDSVGCNRQFWEYYPPTDTWSRKADFPGIGREGALAFTYNGKAYVGMGFACSTELNDLWEYDPILDHWIQKDSLPSIGRYSCDVTVIDSFAFVLGGINNNAYPNQTWRYDIKNNTWRQMSNMPTPARVGALIFPFRNSILWGYGTSWFTESPHDMYLYNSHNDTWTPVVCQNFVDSIAVSGNFMYGKRGYCVGGTISSQLPYSYSNKVWSFDATEIYDYNAIDEVSIKEDILKIYPNPIQTGSSFRVSSSLSGEINFYNSLGQLLLHSKLNEGNTEFISSQLTAQSEIVFYHALLRDGQTQSGKIIVTY